MWFRHKYDFGQVFKIKPCVENVVMGYVQFQFKIAYLLV